MRASGVGQSCAHPLSAAEVVVSGTPAPCLAAGNVFLDIGAASRASRRHRATVRCGRRRVRKKAPRSKEGPSGPALESRLISQQRARAARATQTMGKERPKGGARRCCSCAEKRRGTAPGCRGGQASCWLTAATGRGRAASEMSEAGVRPTTEARRPSWPGESRLQAKAPWTQTRALGLYIRDMQLRRGGRRRCLERLGSPRRAGRSTTGPRVWQSFRSAVGGAALTERTGRPLSAAP
jgi:hypothetical protein